MDEGLPPRVGPYEPIEQLAEGGMARVVVARRSGLAGFERRVALKLILPELAADEAYTTMFLDEARMASRIQHPNVVAVLDVGRDPQTDILYMAMDLVLGATLSAVRRANPAGIAPQAAFEILAQAADGLDAAHCATAADGTPLALVHRDICPQNLLLGFDGFARVSDFGIARAEQRSTKTESGKFKGKLGYCSPEHVLAREVDHRSDLFALAIDEYQRHEPDTLAALEAALLAAIRQAEELRRAAGIERPSWFNLVACDGERAVATRVIYGGDRPESLYYHMGRRYVCDDGVCRMVPVEDAGAVLVASEPLSADPGWQEVPAGHLVAIEADRSLEVKPLAL